MSGKDWFDDFMDYKLSTASEAKESASSGCLPFVIKAILILLLMLKMFG